MKKFSAALLLAAILVIPAAGHAQTVEPTLATVQDQLIAINNKLIALMAQLAQLQDEKIASLENAVVDLTAAVSGSKPDVSVQVVASTTATSTNQNLGAAVVNAVQTLFTPGFDPVSGMPTYEYLRANIENQNGLRRLCLKSTARHENPAVARICSEEHL